jgi:hypothetical protein
MTQAEIKAMRATFAHSTDRQNQGGPNFAMTSVAQGRYFKDGAMNRDPHSDQITMTAPASTPLGRTVRVEHYHYRDKDD